MCIVWIQSEHMREYILFFRRMFIHAWNSLLAVLYRCRIRQTLVLFLMRMFTQSWNNLLISSLKLFSFCEKYFSKLLMIFSSVVSVSFLYQILAPYPTSTMEGLGEYVKVSWNATSVGCLPRSEGAFPNHLFHWVLQMVVGSPSSVLLQVPSAWIKLSRERIIWVLAACTVFIVDLGSISRWSWMFPTLLDLGTNQKS